MASKTIKLKSYPEERAIRAGDFQLLPANPGLPFITSQPLDNLNQYTWIVGVNDGIPEYQNVKPTFNVVRMLQGTSFSFEVRVADPSNTYDKNEDTNLTFKWMKDEAPIYEVNNLNGGVGIRGIFVDQIDSTPLLSGRYTCEISNPYGSVETDPFDLEVINPLKHPKLYKNLILNGDGEGGLDGWSGDVDIKIEPFQESLWVTKNFGSFRLAGFTLFEHNEDYTNKVPSEFRFCLGSHQSAFFNWFNKRRSIDPTFIDTNAKSDPALGLTEDERWVLYANQSQIVLNEDYNKSPYAGFFPGIAWMDLYNKNQSNQVIGLYSEFKQTIPNYFTRDRLKFEKFGGKSVTSMTQTIDLTDAADLIDGSTYGVKHTTSQFFAYVGIGITDYKIRCQTVDGERFFNYYIQDSEFVYQDIVREVNPKFPYAAQRFDLSTVNLQNILNITATSIGLKFELLPDTDIEIIPQCYDQTDVTISYFDSTGRLVKQEEIPGPRAIDIWAIKEKAYFPLTLFSIFRYIKPNNNNITVFGQKYTDTNALSAFFKDAAGLIGRNWQQPLPTDLYDVAAKHFLNKYDFLTWNGGYPGYAWYAQKIREGKGERWYDIALNDYGAAAMIGIGKDIIVPTQTRTVDIKVQFTHTSDIIGDTNPEIKGWTSQEIYNNEFGNSNGTSRRLTEYGNPRCGITKMKFILTPNNIEISDRYLTYSLPPSPSTVLGLQKKRYEDPAAYNTADATAFQYVVSQPDGLPEPPVTNNPFILADQLAAYEAQRQRDLGAAQNNIPDNSSNTSGMPDERSIVELEDGDTLRGDYNESLGITNQQLNNL